jgi:hypothetical protein
MSYLKRSLPSFAALALLLPSAALAQNVDDTFISFENTEADCDNLASPGSFSGGYKDLVPTTHYASCGLASVTSVGGVDSQQLHDPSGTIAGMHGSVVLAGGLAVAIPLTFKTIELLFAPDVNELEFDVLDLNNNAANALTVRLFDANNNSLGTLTRGTQLGATVHVETTSATGIRKIAIEYLPSGLLDGWFVDSLRFNVWSCGDGETEMGEDCDDANDVVCDGCDNDCNTSLDGCLASGGCVADGATAPGSFGCATCDLMQRTPGSDIGYSPAAATTACDDGAFCTVNEACNGTGECEGATRDCADTLDCSADSCDEGTDTCLHTVAAGCLIDGACHATSDRNPDQACEACVPSTNPSGWTALTNGETCGDPSCSEGVLTPAPTCNSGGECEAGESVNCDGAVCADSVSCIGDCKEDDDCLEELHCEDSMCVPDIPPGQECGRDGECSTGYCVDGVCCDRACGQGCESCKLEGRVGLCTAVTPGSDPEDECAGEGVCSAEQTCVTYEVRGNGFCAVPTSSPSRGLGELAVLGVLGAAVWRRRRRG